MPSSNHRSSRTHSSRRTQSVEPLTSSRPSSLPHRQFTVVLTNNAELLRHTLPFQPQTGQRIPTAVLDQNGSLRNATTNNNNREQLLYNLLQVELGDVARDYMSRTRQPCPIYYVFDMSDMEPAQQP